MLAERFLFKRTMQATFKSIEKKLTTFFTDRIFLQWQLMELGLVSGDDRPVVFMFLSTVDRSKLQQHLEILDLFWCQWLEGFH
jgi:hypothetical protein